MTQLWRKVKGALKKKTTLFEPIRMRPGTLLLEKKIMSPPPVRLSLPR